MERCCRLCHCHDPLHQCHKSRVTTYSSPTKASIGRQITLRDEQKAKRFLIRNSPPIERAVATRQGLGCLDLPPELRIQIYAYCVEAKAPKDSQLGPLPWCHINRTRKVGGERAKRIDEEMDLSLFAGHTFPPSILQLNKMIYNEAIQEIYKIIRITIRPRTLEIMQCIRYWLTKHPVRYTTCLEIPFNIHPRTNSPDFRSVYSIFLEDSVATDISKWSNSH